VEGRLIEEEWKVACWIKVEGSLLEEGGRCLLEKGGR
jgi:hypothetical protein